MKAVIQIIGSNDRNHVEQDYTCSTRLFIPHMGSPDYVLNAIAGGIRYMENISGNSALFKNSGVKRLCVDPMAISIRSVGMDSTQIHITGESSYYDLSPTVHIEHLGEEADLDGVYVVDTRMGLVNCYMAGKQTTPEEHLRSGILSETQLIDEASRNLDDLQVKTLKDAINSIASSRWELNVTKDPYGLLFVQTLGVVSPEVSIFDF